VRKVQRIASIHERLQRWAVWHYTSRLSGNARGLTSPWDAVRVDGSANIGPDTLISATDEEAYETEEAIASFRLGHGIERQKGRLLEETLRAVYLQREGRSLAQTAAVLRIDRRQLHNRLCEADRELSRELLAVAARRADAALRAAHLATTWRKPPRELEVD
jgi:hypothetical protein